jgi:pimeloyl-ACP methyl ester carboxylesterase
VLLVAWSLTLASGCVRHGAASSAELKSDRVLVIIVPGTFGSDGFWTNVVDGQASFASELLRELPASSEIYPFVWASSLSHEWRVEAAANLAAVIDERADDFDRVCIVGHSHGGNVAMMAVARCKADIDMLVCLATPHPYLRMKTSDDEGLDLPIYCSAETRAKTNTLISIYPSTDVTPTFWPNELLTGLSENESIRMTQSWREKHGHPRLDRDHLMARLFERGNIVASNTLDVADANIEVESHIDSTLGITAHRSIHSRRMGEIVGALICDGATDKQLDYLRRLVQPISADTGEPISNDAQRLWLEQNKAFFQCCGWMLTDATIVLDEAAIEIAGDLGGSLPDPQLCLLASDGSVREKTETRSDTLIATWQPRFYIPAGETFGLSVVDVDVVMNEPLGKREFKGDEPPSRTVVADKDKQLYWGAELTWQAMHY